MFGNKVLTSIGCEDLLYSAVFRLNIRRCSVGVGPKDVCGSLQCVQSYTEDVLNLT